MEYPKLHIRMSDHCNLNTEWNPKIHEIEHGEDFYHQSRHWLAWFELGSMNFELSLAP